MSTKGAWRTLSGGKTSFPGKLESPFNPTKTLDIPPKIWYIYKCSKWNIPGIIETLAPDLRSGIGKPKGESYEILEETNSLIWGGLSD
jgi:hypothetical protein